MNVIAPDSGEPDLFAWWTPLLAVARRLREEHEPWALHVDDFRFRGWVKRAGKATLSVYQYRPTLRDVVCDAAGNAYLFQPFTATPEKGRIKQCRRDTAMFDAGVPFIPLENDEPYDGGDYAAESRPRRRSSFRPRARSRAHLRLL